MNKGFSNKTTYFLFSIPGIALYTVFFIVPFIFGVAYSFYDWNGINPHKEFIGLKNYISQFSDANFLYSFKFTVLYALALVVVVTFISFLLALFLNGIPKGKTVMKSLYFFPAIIGGLVLSLVWNQIFLNALPVIGKTLGLDFLSGNLLAKPSTAIGAIFFVQTWQAVALPTVLFISALQVIPLEVYEAAKMDGANFYHRVQNIVIPYVMPMLSIVIILTLKNGLLAFDYMMGLTKGGPGYATTSLSMYIYRIAFQSNKFGYATSVSVTVFLVLAVVAFIQLGMSSKKEVNAGE